MIKNTAVINIKTTPELKQQAQELADEMGISLSAVVKIYLRKFIQEKSVSVHAEEGS